MPLYMTQFAYTTEAWAALVDNPEDRSAPVREVVEAMGGRLIGWYLSMGDYDGFSSMRPQTTLVLALRC
jgi:uncharacterized protein with GYD domain